MGLPKLRTRLIRLPSLTVVALVLVLAACSHNDEGKDKSAPPTDVDVATFDSQNVPLINTATGRLSAFKSADVRARVSGVLQKRTYEEGSEVKKGQQLFQIDPAPLQAQVNAARADLSQAQASATNSHVAAERARRLAPKGYVSQSNLDDAEAKERTDRASVQAFKAKLEDAQIKLGYAKVTAPIDGIADKQQVTEGALVGEGEATLLTTVRQVDPLYVNFTLPVELIDALRVAQSSGKTTLVARNSTKIKLKLPGGADYEHEGTMDFSDMFVNPSTGSVSLRASIPNPDHVLLPGMYTELEAHMGTIHDAYLIPQSAVLRDDDSAYVLVVNDDDKVKRKDISTQGMQAGDWLVTDGITSDDRIITHGLQKVQLNAKVKPHQDEDEDQHDDAKSGDNVSSNKPTQTHSRSRLSV